VSEFMMQNSYTEAQGSNIVNVILVDFRGLDTMGEIIVLTMAALGVFVLMRMRRIRLPEILGTRLHSDDEPIRVDGEGETVPAGAEAGGAADQNGAEVHPDEPAGAEEAAPDDQSTS